MNAVFSEKIQRIGYAQEAAIGRGLLPSNRRIDERESQGQSIHLFENSFEEKKGDHGEEVQKNNLLSEKRTSIGTRTKDKILLRKGRAQFNHTKTLESTKEGF